MCVRLRGRPSGNQTLLAGKSSITCDSNGENHGSQLLNGGVFQHATFDCRRKAFIVTVIVLLAVVHLPIFLDVMGTQQPPPMSEIPQRYMIKLCPKKQGVGRIHSSYYTLMVSDIARISPSYPISS